MVAWRLLRPSLTMRIHLLVITGISVLATGNALAGVVTKAKAPEHVKTWAVDHVHVPMGFTTVQPATWDFQVGRGHAGKAFWRATWKTFTMTQGEVNLRTGAVREYSSEEATARRQRIDPVKKKLAQKLARKKQRLERLTNEIQRAEAAVELMAPGSLPATE
jgi:hypothetical protein